MAKTAVVAIGGTTGSVRHIVDASLDSVYSVNYAPYGELWNAQGTSPMPFGFTGEWQDPNDLLFLRARYYNPAQAAFLSLDPLEGGVGNVRALNRFAYVAADPINLVDPSGLIFEEPPIGCGGSGSFPRQEDRACQHLGHLSREADKKCGWLKRFDVNLAASSKWEDYQVAVIYDSIYKQARQMFCLYANCSNVSDTVDSDPPPINVAFFKEVFNSRITFQLVRTTSAPGGGSAYTRVVGSDPSFATIELAEYGKFPWDGENVEQYGYTFSESLVAHELGHVFSGLYNQEMQVIGVDSLAQRIINQRATELEYSFDKFFIPNFATGDVFTLEDWDVIGQALPYFEGGDPRQNTRFC